MKIGSVNGKKHRSSEYQNKSQTWELNKEKSHQKGNREIEHQFSQSFCLEKKYIKSHIDVAILKKLLVYIF